MPAGPTYEPIATTTLGSDTNSITFSSISSSYTDLIIIMSAWGSVGGTLLVQLNSDTGSNYSQTYVYGNGTSAISARNDTQTTMQICYNGMTTTTNNRTFFKINLFNYLGSTNKTVLAEVANDNNGSGSVERSVHLWRNTSAVNTIKLFISGVNNLKTGTTATLYGIKAA